MARFAFVGNPGIRPVFSCTTSTQTEESPSFSVPKSPAPTVESNLPAMQCSKCGETKLAVTSRGVMSHVKCTAPDCKWESQVPSSWGWQSAP